MMPVNVFDKVRFNNPIITKLIKGKSGIKKMYLDIKIDYFLLTIGYLKPSINSIRFILREIGPLSIFRIFFLILYQKNKFPNLDLIEIQKKLF